MTVRPEQLDQIVSGRAVFFIPEDCREERSTEQIRKMQKKYFWGLLAALMLTVPAFAPSVDYGLCRWKTVKLRPAAHHSG